MDSEPNSSPATAVAVVSSAARLRVGESTSSSSWEVGRNTTNMAVVVHGPGVRTPAGLSSEVTQRLKGLDQCVNRYGPKGKSCPWGAAGSWLECRSNPAIL
ncbi:hypothetical protein GCM10010289_26690 [Streptomyces violascens]|uniref:Uncharacterized protein n=1 Tax=Streptomyces violascens TaxID=67381 RepID=A0ABQ3QHP6_9ACTN|nr:hypothetical protein GCM10010289_26690 [Streptomyces violascens]GHI36805.1 hypothetical protein Sviol_12130 [Streptomyces violascens]